MHDRRYALSNVFLQSNAVTGVTRAPTILSSTQYYFYKIKRITLNTIGKYISYNVKAEEHRKFSIHTAFFINYPQVIQFLYGYRNTLTLLCCVKIFLSA